MLSKLDIPAAWEGLNITEEGVVLVVGAPDVGKSTFARYLFQRFQQAGKQPALIDGDPGQSSLGPPTTLTLAFDLTQDGEGLAPSGPVKRYFAGATTPSGHMLPVLVGAARLVEVAHQAGAAPVIYDSSGLIDPSQGGLALKSAKVELLQPAALVAIQHQDELEPLLLPLRRSRRVRVIDLRPSPAVVRRSREARRRHRQDQWRRFFHGARPILVPWGRLAVFPYPRFRVNRLVALEDQAGFTLGLGIVTEIDRTARRITLYTSLSSLDGVNALRLGDNLLDPDTFQDEKIG